MNLFPEMRVYTVTLPVYCIGKFGKGYKTACPSTHLIELCSFVRKKLPWEKVHEIVNEAVEIETNFVCDALPCALIGMNSELMSHYIKFVADHLLVALGYQKKYNVENPFDWMEFISLQ
nr:ribonucleoside-diphosphate reductase small chain A [Ipomoea batatas]